MIPVEAIQHYKLRYYMLYYLHVNMYVNNKGRKVSMSGATVPLSTMVPISVFSRGHASQAFSQVQNGQPVTVLRNNKPTYIIISEHDYEHYAQLEQEVEALRNEQARWQAEHGVGLRTFDSVQSLREYYGD